MIIMQRGRQGGKTHNMMEILLRSQGTILVVPNEQKREYIIRHYKLDEGTADRIFTMNDVKRGTFDRERKGRSVLVDDLDLVLADVFGTMPYRATSSLPIGIEEGGVDLSNQPERG